MLSTVLICPCAKITQAQTKDGTSVAQQIQQLEGAMSKAQAQIEESQRELIEMRRQLSALQAQMISSQTSGQDSNNPLPSPPALDNTSTVTQSEVQDIRERQDMQEAQIATHEQIKVESESKYPVKITGLLLLNGFVNTRAVDMPSTPTVAIHGSGSTGAALRQTVLGFDATGPHLFNARSYANLRVDFNGNPQSNSPVGAYSGYYGTNTTLLRLRTAHAGLKWKNTEAFFSLDKPLLSPDSPTSLTAVAEPALAWSGDLWTWNPQLGVSHALNLGNSSALQLQAALIDAGDAPVIPSTSTVTGSAATASSAERSRWPGTEVRIALIDSALREDGNHFGVGGYFAPHLTPTGQRFNAWAGTVDTQLHLPLRLELTGSFYRGLGLGGLGAGAYKDYGYLMNSDSSGYDFRPFDDVGGWAQLKEKISERLQFNAAFGLDNVFARQLRYYAVSNGTAYQNLARNRTYTGNVIYSPTAYLMFSLEYRHLESAPVLGSPLGSNIVGIAAGYKF